MKKQEKFLCELNKCKNLDEVKKFIDSIIENFESIKDIAPNEIGSGGNMFSNKAFKGNGLEKGFISEKTKISNATLGAAYRIYDNEYLYEFANTIKNMNLPDNTNLLLYVMPFLDHYFGFPKDNVDRRDDVLYEYAVKNAEQFYKEHDIEINEKFGDAITQMQISGEYPINAFKGKSAAQCVERGVIAQNILKVCGFNSSLMFGEVESRGETGGHCWNSILDNDEMLIVDFSNTAYSYKDGNFEGRRPYSFKISSQEFYKMLNNKKDMESQEFHYENGKKVYENRIRKYAIGRSINRSEKIEQKDFKKCIESGISLEKQNKNSLEIQEKQNIEQIDKQIKKDGQIK